MARAVNTEIIDRFEEFYRNYYRNEIGDLAQKYPNEQKSLYVDYEDLYQFDPDVAADFTARPRQMQDYAEEALRLYDLPVDVKLGQAHVRVHNLTEPTNIREITSNHVGNLVSVQGIVRTASDVNLKIQKAAFACQRCGTMTRVPQTDGTFQEPHECQGCERQGPFQINSDQSEFVDTQTIQLLEDPANLPSGISPQAIDIHIEDDITGDVTAGDHVIVTGIIRLEQRGNRHEKSPVFDIYMQGRSVRSLNHDQPKGNEEADLAVADLDVYSNLAATALNTLPEDAREEETKAKLITPFVEALGWNKFDSTEVRLEYTDSKTSNRPDYALFAPDSDLPSVIIEAKQHSTNLVQYESQLYDYLRIFSAEWGVLTNGEEFYVYKSSSDGRLPNKLAEIRIDNLSQANIVDSLRRSAFYE